MPLSDDFRDYILELLEPLGAVQAKRMFGGAGLYMGGGIFALLAGDVLYLKADDMNRGDFEAEGMTPFSPFEDGRMVLRSYYECPPRLLEDQDELCAWARKAWEAGRRAEAAKTKRKRKKG